MKTNVTRIILISPSWIIRTGLGHIIGEERDLLIVDSISDLSCLNTKNLSNYRANVIVLDPSASSAAGIHSLKDYYEVLKDCIIIGALNAAYSQSILDQFNSYFTINDSPTQIIKKIREALSSSEKDESGKDGDQNILSIREKEILAEVAKGLTNKEIADKLCISIFTVTTHRKNISQKLGIRSIAGLTVYAVMNGIISQDQLI